MENLDTETSLFAVVRTGAEEIVNQKIMQGEKHDFYFQTVQIQFGRDVNVDDEDMTIEITHPGIPGNQEPHVRLQVADFALLMKDDTIRPASVNMEEASNFTDKHHEDYPPGHLNFVDGARSSGQMKILLP
jgi:hypothetical protein